MENNTQITEEIWIDIPGYEGIYKVSDMGRVLSVKYYGKCDYSKILKFKFTQKGYLRVSLCKGGVITDRYIHRLVATSFIPNPNNLSEVNHINLDKSNNKVSNLEWSSRVSNMRHAVNAGHITRNKLTGKINKFYK
ncbi:MAG TPA: NUMOD4 domain-containing protein [Nitrososphaeraceae archaeon]